MLKKLSVENYALIDKLELGLSESLNIITGETGAGKSILLGALGLLLGNRADGAVVKDLARNCIVEGTFDIANYDLQPFFTDNDLEFEPCTIIRRVISPAGKSRAYVNDLPVQQTVLKDLGVRLIDIHSQHGNLMLADEGFRTGILDGIAANRALTDEYKKVYDELRTAERQLSQMRDEAARSRQDEDWLRFQLEQFTQVALRDGEQEELEAEQSELSHAEDITAALSSAISALDEDETGILIKLKQIEQALAHAADYYPRSAEFAGRLRSVLIELKDIERELSAEQARVELNPARLEIVNDRLGAIFSLQQKHRVPTIAELLDIQAGFELRLSVITGNDEAVAELEKLIASLTQRAVALASQITATRRKAADKVAVHVEKTLSSLGISSARFIAAIEPAGTLRASGADEIRFLFSANKNIAPAPVEKTASGGETSRLMLALKSLVAKSTKLPTIIFDEIDSGVSGPIADATGNIIEELSRTMQVINITHLPQVAAKGETHFMVFKDNAGAAPQTRIELLSAERRVIEIANMLSGSTVTDAAKAQAKVLLESGA